MISGIVKKLRCLLIHTISTSVLLITLADDVNHSEMLTEVIDCFVMKRHPEQLINEWKWGYIKLAFAFNFNRGSSDTSETGTIFVACPFSANTNFPSFFKEFPHVYDFIPGERSYFALGLHKVYTGKNRSLEFVYCAKESPIYQEWLNYFKLHEPTDQEVEAKQSTQQWGTIVFDDISFTSSNIDDQFIRWSDYNANLEWVFRFNQRKCVGVMLRRKEEIQKLKGIAVVKEVNAYDLSKLTKEFRWNPARSVKQFVEMQNEHSKRDRTKLPVEHITSRFKDNNKYFQQLKLNFLGVVKTPAWEIFDVPWREFGYYSAAEGTIFIRECDDLPHRYSKLIDSFVIDVSHLSNVEEVILPYNLNLATYLNSPPTNNILYEHIRADGRARIIVQPYIASLYVDGKLNKILVCHDKNGPADHGWSLVRKYYCYEEMPEYFWPVSHAYCPLELD